MKLIFEKSVPGRRCTILPSCDVETAALPESLRRSDKPDLPQLSETDISRHYTELCHQVHGVNCGLSSWLKKQPAEKENIVSYKHLTCSQMRCFFYYNLGGHHGQISEEHRGCTAHQRHAVP